MLVTAYFANDNGSPATGLSPEINIHIVDPISSPIDQQPMVEMGG